MPAISRDCTIKRKEIRQFRNYWTCRDDHMGRTKIVEIDLRLDWAEVVRIPTHLQLGSDRTA
jgi:hypothetical protein